MMEEYDDLDDLPARPRQVIPAADRELLELAARAIGAVRVEDVEGENWVNLHFADGSTIFHWNSLVHGDDAFNLMVDLDLEVIPSGAWVGGGSSELAALVQSGDGIEEVEVHAGDPRAATRRAVTRAAAEIGRHIHSSPE